MSALDPLLVWAKKALHDAGELVDNLVDPRRKRSEFFKAHIDLDATQKFLPIH